MLFCSASMGCATTLGAHRPRPPQAHPFPALLLTVGALVMQMKVRHRQQLLRFALKPHVCTCVCLAGVVLLACSANSAP